MNSPASIVKERSRRVENEVMDNPDMGFVRPQVAPLSKFRSTNDFGHVVESQKPFPTIIEEEVCYYHSSIRNTSFVREDGMKLNFLNHLFRTNLKHDKRYLDNEIADGNRYLRRATADEIDAYEMSIDPKGHIRAKVEDEIRNDSEFILKLEAEVRARIMNENLDSVKIAGVDHIQGGTSVAAGTGNATITPVSTPTPHLKGIVTSAGVKDATASSGK